MPSVFDWLKTKKRSLTIKKKGPSFSNPVKSVIIAIAVLLVLIVLRYSSQIIHPFIWALITTYIFAPMIYSLEQRSRIPRGFWILFLYIVLGIAFIWALTYAIPIANNEISDLIGQDQMSGQSFLSHIEDIGKTNLLGINIDLKDVVSNFRVWIRHEITSLAVPFFLGFMERLILISAYFIFTFYLLLDGEKYIRLLLLLFPKKYRKEITNVAGDVNDKLGIYIRGQVILIMIMSIVSWIVLTILKVRFAFVLCLATGVLEVIPMVGPIIATCLAAFVAFYQPVVAYGLTNITLTLIVIAVYYILRQIEDLIVIPNVVGKFIHVHPVVVLLAFFVGARIAGVLGIFLALPVSAVLKVLLNYFYPKLVG